MKLRAFFALGTLIFAAAMCQAEIGIGDPRNEVLRLLGKPSSIAKRGGHEIFLYPSGGRVEMVDGQVVDVKGPLPTFVIADAARLAPGNESVAEKALPPPPQIQPPTTTPPPLRHHSINPENDNPAIAANELAKHVEKMDTAWGVAPPKQEKHAPLDSLPLFLTGLFIRLLFTIVALKLAFRYWEMDAFWTGILLIAGIDMTLHATLELLGPASDGLTTLFVIENGIPGVVMIYTIHRFCFNKRIQNAMLTAAAVKVVATLLYIFAGIAVMNIVYS